MFFGCAGDAGERADVEVNGGADGVFGGGSGGDGAADGGDGGGGAEGEAGGAIDAGESVKGDVDGEGAGHGSSTKKEITAGAKRCKPRSSLTPRYLVSL